MKQIGPLEKGEADILQNRNWILTKYVEQIVIKLFSLSSKHRIHSFHSISPISKKTILLIT